jgi:sec-independent protein translocase protein TatC
MCPESDEEMPLAEHIEEMMRRLAVVFAVAGAVALTLLGLGEAFTQLPTAVELIDALWNNAIPGAPEMSARRPRLYGPLELILTKLKVTGLAGLLIGLRVFVYESYLFMRPGLYRNERRYYLAAVPTSLVLGTIGMAFAHYVIIPAVMNYFTVYTQENVTVAYGLAETFNLILVLMAYMAVVFQIPLFIMLAIMMGLVTRLWLEDKRLLFWGAFLTIAFLINPDPTGMTPFIIAATMIVLYEGTLAMLRWTGN